MRSTLNRNTVFQHDNLIAVTYSRESVRYDNAGNTALFNGIDYIELGFCIQRAGCLVQNHNGRVFCKNSCNLKSLSLSARKILAALGNLIIVTAVAPHDLLVNLCVPCRQDHFKILNGGIPHFDVIRDAVLKQRDLLIDHGDRPRKHIAVDL